jgi:hypothetical protein
MMLHSRRRIVGGLILTPTALACSAKGPLHPPIRGLFVERFEHGLADWGPPSEGYRLVRSMLVVAGPRNRPLWLRRPLPWEATIELLVHCPDEAPRLVGDLKFELYGDGVSTPPADRAASYRSTGYLVVLGGWRNTSSVIVRGDESLHEGGARRVTPPRPMTKVRKASLCEAEGQPPVLKPLDADGQPLPIIEGRRTYQVRLTRRGGTVTVHIDGELYLTWTDEAPLSGPQHAYFALNGWTSRYDVEEVRVTPV